jgi:hypothetical protein
MRFNRSSAALSALVVLGLCACGGASSDPSQNLAQNAAQPAPVAHDGDQGNGDVLGKGATGDAGSTNPPDASDGGQQNNNGPTGQSLIWVWYDYPNSLAKVFANPKSFTHVSPALYQINYSYTGGLPQWWQQTSDDFDGLTSAQIAAQVHSAGMKVVPLVFGGAGNNGTDQGIQNILSDSPAGTQSSFITSMVSSAIANNFDGYNLDWEVDNSQTPYSGYGAALVSFLGAFQTALHAHGMQLSYDLGSWYLKQSWCSGGAGVVDLTTIGSVVDLAIVEDYASTLGTASSSCPASLANPQLCGTDFMSVLNLMCVYVPNANISIGFNANPASGSNPIAGAVIAATETYGIKNVAVWPDWNADGLNGSYVLVDANNIQPSGSSWYSLLAGFLAY